MDIRHELVIDASRFLGYPSMRYKNPLVGQDETGFDCSGFLSFLLRRRSLPIEDIRHANEFFDRYGIPIHPEAVDVGDIVFFSRNGCVPRHVGVMVSPTVYIHAPGRDGTVVEIKEIEQVPIAARPGQIYFYNPIGFKRLAVREGRYQRIL